MSMHTHPLYAEVLASASKQMPEAPYALLMNVVRRRMIDRGLIREEDQAPIEVEP